MHSGDGPNLTEAGGEGLSVREHLLKLDQILDRRAASIQVELQEIAQVRKRIEFYLTPAGNDALKASLPSGHGGANLGQMI